jgi:riboflavin synthase
MNQGLLWLADNLRVSYGQGGLLDMARMILRANRTYPLHVGGRVLPRLDCDAVVSLRWPDWYPDDALDGQRTAETLISLVAAQQMSRETALRVLAASYDIEDVDAELQRIAGERDHKGAK